MASTDVGQLTSSELATCLGAATAILHQTDPDILTPTLRVWLGGLFRSLDDEKMRRYDLSKSMANVSSINQHAPHDES
jgi:hypothetical protein